MVNFNYCRTFEERKTIIKKTVLKRTYFLRTESESISLLCFFCLLLELDFQLETRVVANCGNESDNVKEINKKIHKIKTKNM